MRSENDFGNQSVHIPTVGHEQHIFGNMIITQALQKSNNTTRNVFLASSLKHLIDRMNNEQICFDYELTVPLSHISL